MTTNIKDDNRGIAQILYIILVVVVIIVIGLIGWRVLDKNKKSTNTSSDVGANNPVSSSCLATYHDSNLCHFSESSTSFNKASYTAKITEVQSGTTSTMTLENDGKGNTELNATSNGQTINSITLNGDTYIENSDSWIKYPSGASAATTDPTSGMNIGVGSAGISFKYIDTQACGSLTCYKYQVTDTAAASGTQYVLFDNSSYLLREWLYTDTSGNTTDMSISYGAVNITAPSPVQTL
jgi:outer membrane lipoprotein-sorting protein